MNIRDAKDQVKYAVRAYLAKDEFGDSRIPLEQQRPVFLMGPPGIGKTAIVQQVAEEMGIAAVSYSMTHHTRQSALGLPYIEEKQYGDGTYKVSEYTMSEIIASMYECMEESGRDEGILFLDEINCVSETLAPSMLQFLQFKTFGRHRIPDGWVVVTAGNPPEYNNSVRDFDLVTWDRLKRIDIEPDYRVWRIYAQDNGVHPLILSYLDIRSRDFYAVENTVDGKVFVTARGWMDLSEMMYLYEENGFPVDERLIRQYVQSERIARDFSSYYDLFCKYRSEYKIEDILNGQVDDEITSRAADAPFDERLAVIRLLLDGISGDFIDVYESGGSLLLLKDRIRERQDVLSGPDRSAASDALREIGSDLDLSIRQGQASRSMSRSDARLHKKAIQMTDEMISRAQRSPSSDLYSIVREVYAEENSRRAETAAVTSVRLDNIFRFCEDAFGEDKEMLILVTDLTENFYSADFISHYGCDAYFRHNEGLLFYERHQDIVRRLEEIDL